MSRFDRRKFLITGAAVLGASGIAAKIGWWYLAQRMPSTAMDAGAHAAGEFPNPLRLPGSSGVLGVLDVSSPLIIVAKDFGIRFAVGSGVLAARSLMDSGNYNVRWRHAFLPGLRAGVVNRAVFGSMGNAGYRRFLQKASASGDARQFLHRYYGPSWLKSLFHPWAQRRGVTSPATTSTARACGVAAGRPNNRTIAER
jgi:hypothetical protein